MKSTHAPKSISDFLYPKSSALDEFSKIGLGHGPILQKKTEKTLMKFSWLSFPGIDLSHAPETRQ